MLYREIIAVCSQIHTIHINTLCGQNVHFLHVIRGGEVNNGISVVKTRWPRLGEQELGPESKDAFAQNTAWPHPCNTFDIEHDKPSPGTSAVCLTGLFLHKFQNDDLLSVKLPRFVPPFWTYEL